MTIFPDKEYDTHQSKDLHQQTGDAHDTTGGIEPC
jgi:hypothetical protein